MKPLLLAHDDFFPHHGRTFRKVGRGDTQKVPARLLDTEFDFDFGVLAIERVRGIRTCRHRAEIARLTIALSAE